MLLQVLENGEIEFPITLEELHKRFPCTSFGDPIQTSVLPLGYWVVYTADSVPEYEPPFGKVWDLSFPQWDGEKWVQTWDARPLTESEITDLSCKKRMERNALLSKTDWTQLRDIPEKVSQSYSEYRQRLRDITKDPLFPFLDLPEF